MENNITETDGLKTKILSTVDEVFDSIKIMGKLDFFQITLKHINGELVIKTDFFEKSCKKNSNHAITNR